MDEDTDSTDFILNSYLEYNSGTSFFSAESYQDGLVLTISEKDYGWPTKISTKRGTKGQEIYEVHHYPMILEGKAARLPAADSANFIATLQKVGIIAWSLHDLR